MTASQRKTLSSAFVITVVIIVFFLTATSRALAHESAQTKEDASGDSTLADQQPKNGGSGPAVEFRMCHREQFALLIVLVALAAYLRPRIEWAKDRIRSRKRLRYMLVVELLIAVTGLLLVFRICSERLGWLLFPWPDGWFLVAFLSIVVCLLLLLFWQCWLDYKWTKEEANVSPRFLEVETQTNGMNRHMKIRFADIVTMTEGDDNQLTVLKLKPGAEVTVKKSWAQWKDTREFEH